MSFTNKAFKTKKYITWKKSFKKIKLQKETF